MQPSMADHRWGDGRRAGLGRREFLKIGILGGLGLSDVLRAEAASGGGGRSRRPSVIILWMRGGPPHLDMWDPKPDAAEQIRGEFATIATSVPGIYLTEMLPLSASIMKKWSLVRSLTHNDPGHSTADQICFTGYRAGANPDENISPSCGSIVARQLGPAEPGLPAYVMIPRMVPGTGSAYLGAAYAPFETLADPAQEGPFRVPELTPPAGVSAERLGDRRDLLAQFDGVRESLHRLDRVRAFDDCQAKAWDILTSERARSAFDLDAEPREIRERYGFMPAFDPKAANRCGSPAWSQRLLLARRLVEAGVRLVTVDLRWWDTHVKNFESLRLGFLPRFDRAYSALIEDLERRGLLDSTLVVAWGEFGRTPLINKDAGRDHYPNVFSAAIAGGGVVGGRVVGSSDSKGAFPASNPKTPQDVLATIYRHLGVDTEAMYYDQLARPIPVLRTGQPIEELF